MKKLLAFSILIVLFACNNVRNNETNLDSISELTVDTLEETPIDDVNKWKYETTEDPMTSNKTIIAYVFSPDLLNFEFPYNGGSTMSLTLRKKRGVTDILIRVDKGQFNTNYDGTVIKARFDSDPASNYSVSGAADGSSDVVFIDNVSRFIKNLKSSKTLLIEAEFYNEGNHVAKFDVSDLKWK